MAIVFNCPHCGELHRVKDELAGKVGKCKSAACRQQIFIPLKSIVGANGVAASGPMNAEALAAAAFAEEAAPIAEKQTRVAKIAIKCPACDHPFEVDSAMQGKNTRCPECGNVFRVPKVIDDKPADWRGANAGRPSLAKSTEPAPEGVWGDERKGVGVDALRKAGAHEVEEEEDPRDRRVRRVKQLFYGAVLLGMVAIAVIFIGKVRRESKEEKWMEMAVKEIENKDVGSKRPEFKAAIYRFSAEYRIRSAKKREDLDDGLKQMRAARGLLLDMPGQKADRNGMLLEVGLAFIVCGGDANEINEDKRISWDKVQPEIRKSLNAIVSNDRELPMRAMRLMTRRLAAKEQGLLAATIARSCANDAEQPEMAGRVGIELFLAGKKDLAESVLAKAPQSAAPALTALWLGLHPDQNRPPANFPRIAPPSGRSATRDARLAYAEGLALQGKIAEGKAVAELQAGTPLDRAEALVLVAAAAVETNRTDEAGPILDSLVALVKTELKGPAQPSWLLLRIVELAARAKKMVAAQAVLDAMKDEGVKSWARLQILRVKLAAQPKQLADESWMEPIEKPEDANLPAALAREEVARHNAAAGETSYTKIVENFAKGTIRPFGYAGIALGTQDRNLK